MNVGGKVSIDIADDYQSVTKTVKKLLGDEVRISPEDVTLMDNGWLRLRRDGSHMYISPMAVASVLVEGGHLPSD